MLQNIHIQNFRCFEDFKAEGFERINLIGGKNNSGKTCLLEAILALRNNPSKTNQLYDIAGLRNEKVEDLIFQNLRIGLKVEGFISVSANQIGENNHQYIYSTDVNKNLATAFLKSNLDIFYISQTKTLPKIDFNDIFYRIEKEDATEKFIEVLSKIDTSIKKIRTIGEDGPIPQIKQTQNNNFLKLSSYGDAVKSIMCYFSPIIEREVFEKEKMNEYILLIDEIENGLHYTVHYDFWKKIFTSAKKLNIQVFATTHSLEMIQQFNKVAKEFELENPEDKGAYFEMIRNVRTNKIVAHKYNEEELEYSLENEKTFRGE
jgi:AAA15 family ATPase/GTPase